MLMGRDLRIARAVGAADVTAVGALLVSVREQGVALVAVTANTLGWLLKNKILPSVASWLGDQWLARLSLARGSGRGSSSSAGASSGSSGLLNTLWWRAGAVLATLVGALWADLLPAELRLALVASAVDTETDLLLDTLRSLAEVDGIDGGWVNAGLLGDLELVLIVLGLALWCWSGLGGGGSLGAEGSVLAGSRDDSLVCRLSTGNLRWSGGGSWRCGAGRWVLVASSGWSASDSLSELGDVLLESLLLLLANWRCVLWRAHVDGGDGRLID